MYKHKYSGLARGHVRWDMDMLMDDVDCGWIERLEADLLSLSNWLND